MPTPTTLQKANYLKKLMHDALELTTGEAFNDFNHELSVLISTLNDLETGKIQKVPVHTLKYNRGDHKKNRFAIWKQDDQGIIEDQISRLCKTYIENLETQGMPKSVKHALQQNGVYSILYHNSIINADFDFILAGEEILQNTQIKLAWSAVSIALFALVSFIGPVFLLPLATALFAASMAYMSGLLYGILNDILATRSNLAYFILGHQFGQRSFFVSNNVLVQAIGWGVVATTSLSQIAAMVFAAAIFITASLSTTPLATFLLPLLVVIVPLAVLLADLYARHQIQNRIKNGFSLAWIKEDARIRVTAVCQVPFDAQSIPLDKIDFDSPALRTLLQEHKIIDEYQLNGLALMSSSVKEKAAWLANGDRNLAGYIGAPLMAVGLLIGILSISKTAVAPALFSTFLSTTLPIITASILVVGLACAIFYARQNAYEQIDDKYKLNWTNNRQLLTKPNTDLDKLYFTEEHSQLAMDLSTNLTQTSMQL